jgi:mannose-6-phosphate isomerase
MEPAPFRIEPTFSPRLWGAKSLAPIFPDKAELREPIGEAWLTDVNCRIANGAFGGKSLAEAWRAMPAEWRGLDFANPGDFPLLVKFIFPTDKLSIQVHPDDSYASIHERAAGGCGKTEMWHLVSAKPGASLLLGLKSGATRESFLAALANSTLEELFQRHAVKAGDTFFVRARTPHTIGADMVICEVQQYSDLTYRVYDYDRRDANGKPRELHLAKAMDVIDFGPSSVNAIRWAQPMDEKGMARVEYLTACRYFAVEKWNLSGDYAKETTDAARFELLIILKGKGDIRWDSMDCDYSTGDAWFLPASLGKYMVGAKAESEILRVYVPDLMAYEQMFAVRGYSEQDRRKFIFL